MRVLPDHRQTGAGGPGAERRQTEGARFLARRGERVYRRGETDRGTRRDPPEPHGARPRRLRED